MVVIFSVFMSLMMVATITCNVCFAAKEKEADIKEPSVRAGSYVVMSGSTSEIVYDVHDNRKMPMGNITKYMTAMVVIDNMYDDSEYEYEITVNEKVAEYGDEFKVGDTVTVEDMLYAMLVGGSDEAAEALARYSASDREIFINEMNSKVMELSLMNTQYHNPTGRYHAEHYSTASDCAKIVQAAMRYSKIKEISGTDSYTIAIQGKKHDRNLTVTNTNPLTSGNKSSDLYGKSIGGILGDVDVPGESERVAQYAGIAVDKGMQLIVILLDADGDRAAKDAKGLFEYGFKKVTRGTIVKAGKEMGKVRVYNGARTRVKAYTETRGYAYIPPEGSTDLVQTVTVMNDNVKAPLKAGDKVGEFRIYVADELKGTVDLVVKKDVEVGWFPSKIYISNVASVIIAVILLAVILLVIRIVAVKRRRARMRALKRQQKIHEEALKQMALEEDRRRRNWTYK